MMAEDNTEFMTTEPSEPPTIMMSIPPAPTVSRALTPVPELIEQTVVIPESISKETQPGPRQIFQLFSLPPLFFVIYYYLCEVKSPSLIINNHKFLAMPNLFAEASISD